ncbi:MAG: ATP-binding protein [Verrucomicrobiia bacterium]
MTQVERTQKFFEASKAFTPSAPVDNYNLFAGRTNQISQVLNAVAQKGQHVVIYGERGVGKTSLANVLKHLLANVSQDDNCVIKINCEGKSTPSSIWRTALREIPSFRMRQPSGFSGENDTEKIELNTLIPDEVSADDVRYVLRQLPGEPVIIFDEVDRIKSKKTITALSDTIKSLSDNAVPTTLILVGVADSVGGLIAEHESIERALVQVLMPRMSPTELREIVSKGLDKVGMTITETALGRIVKLSHGLPHYTHLLALHATQSGISSDCLEITNKHVHDAVNESVEKAQQSIHSAYHTAVTSSRGNLYRQVLLACALAEVDELGYFQTVNVREPMTRIMKKPYEIAAFIGHLHDFCSPERGQILQQIGARKRYRYRFVNPLMQPFVVMKGLKDGLITEELWDFS